MSKLSQINPTTFKVVLDEHTEVELGDITKEHFSPHSELKKWGGECSLKVSLPTTKEIIPSQEDEKIKWEDADKEVHLYPIVKKQAAVIDSSILRSISLSDLEPEDHSALWECPRKIDFKDPTLISFNIKKQFLGIGGTSFLGHTIYPEKLPIDIGYSRFYSPGAGRELLFEPSSLFFYLVYPTSWDVSLAQQRVQESIIEVLQEKGIEANENANDIFFKIGENWKKFSGQIDISWGDWTIAITSFAFEFDGDLAEDLYNLDTDKFTKKGEVQSIKDIVGGLYEVAPTLDPAEIEQLVIARISQKLQLSLESSSFTQEEEDKIEELRLSLVENKDEWISEAKRGEVVTTENYGTSDKFEFEVILKEKPSTNKVVLEIESQGLVFHYQPELTQDQINEGCVRPENVIGSYAVYHDTKTWLHKDREDAEKYKTGKAFHIYRPEIKDANGDKIWGELSIENGTLTITISQDWLDNAAYPVSVDPTIGNDQIGGTGRTIAGQGSESRVGITDTTDGTGGVVDWVKASLSSSGTHTCDVKAFINEEDSGGVGTHAQIDADENLACAAAQHWEEFSMNGVTLEASTRYILNVMGYGDAGWGKTDYYYLHYDDTPDPALDVYRQGGATYESPESPWTQAVEYSETRSIYASYTEDSGTTTTSTTTTTTTSTTSSTISTTSSTASTTSTTHTTTSTTSSTASTTSSTHTSTSTTVSTTSSSSSTTTTYPPCDWIGINSSNLISVCGEEGGTTLADALDGIDFWEHQTEHTHEFVVDLKAYYTVYKVRGRSNLGSDPVDVNIYVSVNGVDWGAAVVEGISTWQDTDSWIEIVFSPKYGRFVKVEIIETEDGVGKKVMFGKEP